MTYVPLNIKTDNYLLKSMIKIDDLISFALKNKINTLTITDNNLYGAIEFYKKCLKNNIKPIIGLEVSIPETIILYVRNYQGYQNLMKLSTLISEKDLGINDLINYADNLVCITPYNSLTRYNELKKIFPYIFISYQNEEEKNKIKDNNKVYMHEIRCLTKEDEKYLDVLVQIGDSKIDVKNTSLMPLPTENNENNQLINDLCDVKLLFHQDLLPKFSEDSYNLLKQECMKGMRKIFGSSASRTYIDRLKYELEVINKMGYCDYFLVVADYINYAKTNNILVGPGRGSAAGSLVSYVLGITTINPLKYNLLFERFLNPERVTMPDIDVDFEDTRRSEVINYCIKKYGEKKVVPIITFGTLGPKQAIRDVARVLDVSLKLTDNLCRKINAGISLKDNYKNIETLLTNPILKEVYEIALKLEGVKRHTSLHAAGIIMSKYDLDDYIPLDKSHGDFYRSGYSMEYLEELGLLKMDFLGLKNLSLIAGILKDVNLKFDEIPEDDKKALQIFTKVKTIGIFQFESAGMKSFLTRFKPETFEEIVSALSLFRPGPMKNIDLYIARRNGKKDVDYMHPDLEKILKPTYGIIIYQEQIMQIVSLMAGFSYGQADILRRAMSKKKEEILKAKRDSFIKGSVKNGYSEKLANNIYDLIYRFADYGFNRSHAVSYAMISYRMAYLKAHYPEVFMKHLLTNVQGSEQKTKEYLDECRSLGLVVKRPDINISTKEYLIKDKRIVLPLTTIKSIGSVVAGEIIKKRGNVPFKDIFDFTKRCDIGIKSLETLILAGCFDNLGFNRKTLINNLEAINNYADVGALLEDDVFKPELDLTKDYTDIEKTKLDLDLFGFCVNTSPVLQYKKRFSKISGLNTVPEHFDKSIEVVGQVTKLRIIKTKTNEEMAFAEITDELAKAEVVVFPQIYKRIKPLNKNDLVYIVGKVKKRFANYQIEANAFQKLD